jgi:hypothetical protein
MPDSLFRLDLITSVLLGVGTRDVFLLARFLPILFLPFPEVHVFSNAINLALSGREITQQTYIKEEAGAKRPS